MEEVVMSIVIPVYNGEKYIKECLDSCIKQDFHLPYEIIVVNDGSTDNTLEVIEPYKPYINLYNKIHSNIADTLNFAIIKASGKYIVRMDADDVMYPNRLQVQYEYMEANPMVDIAGFGFEWGNGKEEKEYYTPENKIITLLDLLNGNLLGHPTVIMRKQSLWRLPFWYEDYYKCEDFRLWVLALSYGLNISNCSIPVLMYRQHKDQLVTKNSDEVHNSSEMVKRLIKHGEGKELTCIITFKNENVELEKTLASIRATAKAVKIIVVDDDSDDNWDYKSIALKYNAYYTKTSERLGCAGCRQLGVSLCTTPYFVILDCHMRFYDMNWDIMLLKYLKDNPKSIICSNTSYIIRQNGIYQNEDGKVGRGCKGFAACINMKESGWELTSKWTDRYMEEDTDRLVPVACVLGAVYASSKEHWDNIRGVEGLKIWGSDESLMSIKTWLSGGKCFIIKDWNVGHLYRTNAPFHTDTKWPDRNQLYCIHFFCNEEQIKLYEDNLRKRIGEDNFKAAKDLLMEDYAALEEHKKYFFDNVAKHPLSYFLEINEKVNV